MPEATPTTRAIQAAAATAGYKFFLLFMFLLGYLIFYPYAQTSTTSYAIFRLLAMAITVLSVYAVSFRRSVAVIAVTLAVPALLHRLSILSDRCQRACDTEHVPDVRI